MNVNRKLNCVLALTAALTVAGCGGGGNGGGGGGFPGGGGGGGAGGGSPSTATVPSSALQSVDSFVAYLKGLIATSSDSSDPVQLGDAVAPVSETAEPTGI